MMRIFLLLMVLGFANVYAQAGTIRRVELEGLVTTADSKPIKRAVLYVDSVKTFVRTNKERFL